MKPTKLEQLQRDVEHHGEAHVLIADVGEVEVRKGTADFEPTNGLISLDDGQTKHRYNIAHVVGWYLPVDV